MHICRSSSRHEDSQIISTLTNQKQRTGQQQSRRLHPLQRPQISSTIDRTQNDDTRSTTRNPRSRPKSRHIFSERVAYAFDLPCSLAVYSALDDYPARLPDILAVSESGGIRSGGGRKELYDDRSNSSSHDAGPSDRATAPTTV